MTKTPLCAVLLALSSSACLGPAVDSQIEPEVVHVTLGGEPFASLHPYAEPRPYVHPLYAPGGIPMTRAFPMAEVSGEERDHPHHQSLWFAHGDVNGFDFWHGKGHDERVEWDGETSVSNDRKSCRVRCRYRWVVDEDTVLCREERELVFGAGGDARTIDVSVTLTPEVEPLVLGDTKEGTFALRLHPALRVEGPLATGTLVNSEGDSGRGAWGKRARWVHDSGTVEGVEVGLAIFDHPSNPRHPTWWHARTYGLVAANPFGVHDFEKQPAGTGKLVVPLGEELVLRYRVLVHGPGWDAARVEAAWRAWVSE